MGPDSVELPAVAGGIVDIRIGVDAEGKCREEAEAVMIVTIPVMIVTVSVVIVTVSVVITIPHSHSSHVVLREPARRRIRSHRHHAAAAHIGALDGAAAHMAAHWA
jgi:hypothetical protein